MPVTDPLGKYYAIASRQKVLGRGAVAPFSHTPPLVTISLQTSHMHCVNTVA